MTLGPTTGWLEANHACGRRPERTVDEAGRPSTSLPTLDRAPGVWGRLQGDHNLTDPSGATVDCKPRYATRRRPERETLGPRAAKMGTRLGTPFMGWQDIVADVGLELRCTPGGIYYPAYREIIITIMRQEGKTTVVLCIELDRALQWGKPQRIVYTAQTGNDARKKLLEDQVPLIERSSLAASIKKVRRVNGSEGVNFQGGSQLDVLASSESAGHGRTLDLGIIDEAFDDTDDRREQAMLPAMATRRDAQLWVCSTQGTDASIYLNRKIDAGRDAALEDREDSEIAYFEWSIPDDADIDDPRIWEAYMPAYGITIDERVIRHARQTMTEGDFRRAFCNQRTASDERVIPGDIWDAVNGDYVPERDLVFAIDCNPERTSSALGVASRAGVCEVIKHDQGTSWLVPEAVQAAKKANAAVAYDRHGPAGVFGEELEKQGVKTINVSGEDMAHACSFFFDGVVDQKLRIRSHAGLNAAVAAARKRVSGDAWTWARRDATADLSPLVAVTIASWAVVYARKPVFVY